MADPFAHLTDQQLEGVIRGDFSGLSNDELAVLAGERGTPKTAIGPFRILDRAVRGAFAGMERATSTTRAATGANPFLHAAGPLAGVAGLSGIGGRRAQAAARTTATAEDPSATPQTSPTQFRDMFADAGMRAIPPQLPDWAKATHPFTLGGAALGTGVDMLADPALTAAALVPGLGAAKQAGRAIAGSRIGQGVGQFFQAKRTIRNPFAKGTAVRRGFRKGLATTEQGIARMKPEQRQKYLTLQRERYGGRATRGLAGIREQRELALTESETRSAFYGQQAKAVKQSQLDQLAEQEKHWTNVVGNRTEAGVRQMREEFLPKLKAASDEFAGVMDRAILEYGDYDVPLSTLDDDLRALIHGGEKAPLVSAAGEATEAQTVKASRLLNFMRQQRAKIGRSARAGKAVFTHSDLVHSRLAQAAAEAIPEEMMAPVRAAREQWRKIAPIRDEFVRRFGLNPDAPTVERGMATIQQGVSGESRDARNILRGLEEHFGVKVPDDITEAIGGLSTVQQAKLATSTEMKELERLVKVQASREATDIKTKFLGQAKGVVGTRRGALRTLEGQEAVAKREGKKWMGGEFRAKYGPWAKQVGAYGLALAIANQLRLLRRAILRLPRN